jgi:hypothetical protein
MSGSFKLDEEAMDALWADALSYLPFASGFIEAATETLEHVFLGLLSNVTPDRFIVLSGVASGAGHFTPSIRIHPEFGARFALAAQERLIGGFVCHGSFLNEPVHH